VSGELIAHTPEEIEAFEAARDVGPSDPTAVNAAFSARQLARIDEALTLSSQETGLLFSVYVGALPDGRPGAEALLGQLDAPDDGAVLLAVSPGQRQLHIVTSPAAVRRIPNRAAALAALGMRAAFSGGDLTGGIVTGLRMLADSAGAPPRTVV
jgi:hypothetical protein